MLPDSDGSMDFSLILILMARVMLPYSNAGSDNILILMAREVLLDSGWLENCCLILVAQDMLHDSDGSRDVS